MHSLSLKQKTATLFSMVLLALSPVITHKAFATEITVTGNGEASVNEASVSDSSQVNVTSNNSAEVTNNVQVNAETGNNEVSGNTGDSQVQTGDVAIDTTVVNEMNQTNVTQQSCCSQSGTIVVNSKNGSNSQNTTNVSNSNNANLNINQTAVITNTINGKANTGGNTANNNSGYVGIKTGNITVKDRIINAQVNIAKIQVNQPILGDTLATVIGNGTGTTNSINFLTSNNQTVNVVNYADIFNNIVYDLTTGDNHADNNNGDVEIKTGDISVTTEITNVVNESEVIIDCECKEKPEKPTPTPPADKVTPTPPSPEKPTSGGNGGEVASVAVGKVLPVTGVNWIILAIAGNIMMLFLGMILRLRSGNAPGAEALS